MGDIGRFIGGVSKVELWVLKLGMNGVLTCFLMDGELVDAGSHNNPSTIALNPYSYSLLIHYLSVVPKTM